MDFAASVIDPILHCQYEVVAYDETWGGCGCNASKTFATEQSAIDYIVQLRKDKFPHVPNYEPIRLMKIITMEPIRIQLNID